MKLEDEPIDDEEWLLRRVFIDCFPRAGNDAFSPRAFEPRITGRDPDVDGISLYRLDCVSTPADVLGQIADPVKHRKKGVVKIAVISVRNLREMRLTIRHCPDDDGPLEKRIPGHVLIPELNSIAYAADKTRFTPVLKALADLAGKPGAIVVSPPDLA